MEVEGKKEWRPFEIVRGRIPGAEERLLQEIRSLGLEKLDIKINTKEWGFPHHGQSLDLIGYKTWFGHYFEEVINLLQKKKNQKFKSEDQLYHFSTIYHKILSLYFLQYNDPRGLEKSENNSKMKKQHDNIKKYKRKIALYSSISKYFEEDSSRYLNDDLDYEFIYKKTKLIANDKQICKFKDSLFDQGQKYRRQQTFKRLQGNLHRVKDRLNLDNEDADTFLELVKTEEYQQQEQSIPQDKNQEKINDNTQQFVSPTPTKNLMNEDQILSLQKDLLNSLTQFHSNQSHPTSQNQEGSYFNFFIDQYQQKKFQVSNNPLSKSFESFASQVGKTQDDIPEFPSAQKEKNNIKINKIIIHPNQQDSYQPL